MFKLIIAYPVWVIDYETFKGNGHSFSVEFGPFDSEQQARWFWLSMKEKMKRNYEFAVIMDDKGVECYVDEYDM